MTLFLLKRTSASSALAGFKISNPPGELRAQGLHELGRQRLEAAREGMQLVRPIGRRKQPLRVDEGEVVGRNGCERLKHRLEGDERLTDDARPLGDAPTGEVEGRLEP